MEIDQREERVLTAGDVFLEPANTTINPFDNMSDRDAAVFIAFYLMPPGEVRLIVMSDDSSS